MLISIRCMNLDMSKKANSSFLIVHASYCNLLFTLSYFLPLVNPFLDLVKKRKGPLWHLHPIAFLQHPPPPPPNSSLYSYEVINRENNSQKFVVSSSCFISSCWEGKILPAVLKIELPCQNQVVSSLLSRLYSYLIDEVICSLIVWSYTPAS